jgi:putative tricarboxylic transport membrane protein
MRLHITSVQDFGAGIIFMGFGALAAALAPRYGIGTALRMGPGYFPLVLGGLMFVIGAVLLVRSVRIVEKQPLPPRLRPFAAVIGAAAVFAATVDVAGIVVCSVATLAITYAGMREGNRRELLLLCVGMTTAVCAVFVYVLGMPLSLWPPAWN